MKISIVVPVFNEEKTIGIILDKLLNLKFEGYDKEIVVVNDGSTDSTYEIIKRYAQENRNIKIISHKRNQGKGRAIRSGFKYSIGEIMLIQDADLEYEPSDYVKLLRSLNIGRKEAIYGYRVDDKITEYLWRIFYFLGNRLITFLINLFFGAHLRDAYTCYKILPSCFVNKLNLTASHFELEAEITIKLLKKRYKIRELPIKYTPRTIREGKKIKVIDGIKGIIFVIKSRLLY